MKKKIVGMFVIMLMIFSAMTMILYSNNVKVEASDGEQQGSGGVNLDNNWVWERVKDFSWVVNNTDWSNENNIPKGRSWATAGENYTIARILKPNMNGLDSPCGLTGYKNLSIEYLPVNEPGHPFKPKQYSSKIVVQDFGFVIYNGGLLYRIVPKTEMFPIAVGAYVPLLYPLTNDYVFDNAIIKEAFPWGSVARKFVPPLF